MKIYGIYIYESNDGKVHVGFENENNLGGNKTFPLWGIITIAVGGAIVIAAVVIVTICLIKRKKSKKITRD